MREVRSARRLGSRAKPAPARNQRAQLNMRYDQAERTVPKPQFLVRCFSRCGALLLTRLTTAVITLDSFAPDFKAAIASPCSSSSSLYVFSWLLVGLIRYVRPTLEQ
jgi:hypothetical protein